MLVLLCFSALISGSEVAFFSLSPKQIQNLKEQDSKQSFLALKHLENPQLLLANILIGNNFVNIAIVVVSTFISSELFNFSEAQLIGFIFQVVVVTFLILLFGEIIPKIYANHYSERFALLMAFPLLLMSRLTKPLSYLLIISSEGLLQKFSKKNISMDDVSDALNITSKNLEDKDEKDFLEGIVKLNRIDVTNIMKPRVDVAAVDISLNFKQIHDFVIQTGFSRIPVYEDSFDVVKGILYVKDLLPHLDKNENYRWQTLIQRPYFIPESKKIDDLLEEFQKTKVHLAIVVDEYGGTSGIVTLEDILEEILGEINDEFDEEDNLFTKINDYTYIFDGKFSLNDFYKVIDVDDSVFDKVKGDADTLAGLILEINGDFPKLFDEIEYDKFKFRIEAEDKRRIKKIKVFIEERIEA